MLYIEDEHIYIYSYISMYMYVLQVPKIHEAPEAKDINWSNFSIPKYQLFLRRTFSLSIWFGMLLAFYYWLEYSQRALGSADGNETTTSLFLGFGTSTFNVLGQKILTALSMFNKHWTKTRGELTLLFTKLAFVVV